MAIKMQLKSIMTSLAVATVLAQNAYGINNSTPSALTDVNGTLYFQATDGTNGIELWKSDGTEAGTVMVKDIYSGVNGANPTNLTDVNGVLYFSATDGTNGTELWKSDGTDAGTVMVKNINSAGDSMPVNLTDVNGTLYFSATDGTNGVELWKSDGTLNGTAMVKDISTGVSSSSTTNLTDVNGTLYFTANDGTNGIELWKSDGTSAGTVMVKDIVSGSNEPYAKYLTNVNGTLYFQANDGINGLELWKSDGTDVGTVMVKNIDNIATNSKPANLTNVNGTLYFTANDGTNGYELWKSDGTNAGTVMVKDIRSGALSSAPANLTDVNGTLYFSPYEGTNGYELWKSDGTDAGTVIVKDIASGTGSSTPKNLTNVNGTLYFQATDGTNGIELWKSDGTDAGTVMVKDIYSGGDSTPTNLTNVNGTLYFSAINGTTGTELWKSDGTSAGTVLLKDINPDDTTPPTTSASSISAGATTATLSATINEAGTGYYIVVASGSTAPTAAQVKAGVDYTGGTKVAAGNAAMVAATSKDFAISGLSASTSYSVYFIAQDTATNLQLDAALVTIALTTNTADVTPDAFTFAAKTNQALSTAISAAETVTVAGVNTPTALSITNGTFSKNSGADTNVSSTVVNGDTVTIKSNAISGYGQTVVTALTIGTLTQNFSVTTTKKSLTGLTAGKWQMVSIGNGFSADFSTTSVASDSITGSIWALTDDTWSQNPSTVTPKMGVWIKPVITSISYNATVNTANDLADAAAQYTYYKAMTKSKWQLVGVPNALEWTNIIRSTNITPATCNLNSVMFFYDYANNSWNTTANIPANSAAWLKHICP